METKVVKCLICKKELTGMEAGIHKEETGHNSWELLLPDRELEQEI